MTQTQRFETCRDGGRIYSRGGMNVCARSRRGLAGAEGMKRGEAPRGKGDSYFWLLSRKSNLRSLTPKELQMHGRQHTGVSIYEARTERPGRKMREAAWSDGETAVETADGEMKIRQRERETDKEGESKRVQERRRRSEGGCRRRESLDERAQRPWVRSSASLAHHPRAKTRIFHPSDADPLLES